MPHGAYHSDRNPDGKCVRKDDRKDGRSDKQKNRDIVYYVRLNDEWFDRLMQLLDTPSNREANTAIRGCPARADLIEKAFSCFLQIDAAARELNYRDVEDLVTHMLEGIRFLLRQSAAPDWISIEQTRTATPVHLSLPSPKEE